MRLIKIWIVICILLFTTNINANDDEFTNIKISDLTVMELIKITSKIMNKNILITEKIKGKVDFISNKTVKKDDIINILIYVLQQKGYTIINNNDILRVVKLKDSAQYNVPIIKYNNKNYYQIVTKIFKVDYTNVDYISV